MKAIFKREVKSYFTGMIGWVVAAVSLFFLGLYYTNRNLLYASSDFASVLYTMTMILLFLLPAISMRSFAEERKNRTDNLSVLIGCCTKIDTIFLRNGCHRIILLCKCICFLADCNIICFHIALYITRRNLHPSVCLCKHIATSTDIHMSNDCRIRRCLCTDIHIIPIGCTLICKLCSCRSNHFFFLCFLICSHNRLQICTDHIGSGCIHRSHRTIQSHNLFHISRSNNCICFCFFPVSNHNACACTHGNDCNHNRKG